MWKRPIFRFSFFLFFFFFCFLFLQSRKGFFLSRISLKTFFLPILPKIKRWKKITFLDQNHGLTPVEKGQFFDVFSFLLLQSRKACFLPRIWPETFFFPILPKIKRWKKIPFFDQNHGVTSLEKGQFFDFFASCFYSLERRFFFLEYRQRLFSSLFCQK